MSEIAEIIDTLENKIQKLFKKINDLEEKNQSLKRKTTRNIERNK
jgi:prefoldin subunit 5